MPAWVKEILEVELKKVDNAPQGLWKRYVSLEEDGHGMVFGMGSFAPGEEISHSHEEEELFFTLKGQGEAIWKINGKEYRADLKPGTAFYKTSDIYHTMRNNGDEPLVGIFFKV
ncbi:MAG: cupin domain-containing protein [Anaerolineaceae bacterium]|nr:cupin domain-containing protein [Anaerolineaceae bacterium]